jgi:hypothetical protein
MAIEPSQCPIVSTDLSMNARMPEFLLLFPHYLLAARPPRLKNSEAEISAASSDVLSMQAPARAEPALTR